MSAPVKHTCPDIDRAIKHLKTALLEIKDAIEDRQTFNSIESEIDSAIGYFEDLRKSNDELRAWGEDLDKDLNNAADEIYTLEQKVEELQKQPTE